MDLKPAILLVLQVSVICTVFRFGVESTAGDLLQVLRHPGLLVRALLAVFVVMPVVALLLARFFEFNRTVEIALIALSVSPTPPLLPQRQAVAGGSRSYALGLMAVLSLVAVVAVPLVIEVLELVSGRPLSMPPTSVARIVSLTVLLPLVGGVLVRTLAPRHAGWIGKSAARVGIVLLPVGIVALLIGLARAMGALLGDGTLLAMCLFLCVGLAVGDAMGRPDHHAPVVALMTACRHPALAWAIAQANFPEENVGPAIVLYILVTVVFGLPYIVWQRRRAALGGGPAQKVIKT